MALVKILNFVKNLKFIVILNLDFLEFSDNITDFRKYFFKFKVKVQS